MKLNLIRWLWSGILAGTAALALSSSVTQAGELKLRSQLVWGTDGAKPEGKDLVELDPKLKDKLKALRWKHYWVIKAEETKVDDKEQRAQLGKCSVTLRNVGNGQVEVKLFNTAGEGKHKHLRTVTEPIEKLDKGGTLIIGGDSKDTWDDAWMVIITISK